MGRLADCSVFPPIRQEKENVRSASKGRMINQLCMARNDQLNVNRVSPPWMELSIHLNEEFDPRPL